MENDQNEITYVKQIETIQKINNDMDLIRGDNVYYLLKIYKNEQERKNELDILNKIGKLDCIPNFIGIADPLFSVFASPSQTSVSTNLSDFIFNTNNLIDWEEEDDNMNFDLEISLINQLVTGLNELHKKNITHCCIDLNNILIGDRIVKFINFEKSLSKKPVMCSKMGLIAPEIVEIMKSGQNGEIQDPINFYKGVDIFCLGIVILTILNKKFPFEKLTKENANNLNKYINVLSELYSDQKWHQQYLQSPWDDYEDIGEIRKKIVASRNFLKSYISKMLDTNPKNRVDLQTVIDNIKIAYDSVKNFAKYSILKRKSKSKKTIKVNKMDKLNKQYNDYKNVVVNLQNKIKTSSSFDKMNFDLEFEERQIERGIKKPSKLRIQQEIGPKTNKAYVIDEFRKLLLLRRDLVNKYKDEYNKIKSELDKYKTIKTQDTRTQLWIIEYEKQLENIKNILDEIERNYINLKDQTKMYLEFQEIPLDENKNNKVGGGLDGKRKIRNFKQIFAGGNSGIKRIGKYFFEDKTIGVGSFGKVYMGWNKDGKIYIIKQLPDNAASANEILNLRDIRKQNGDKCYNNILCYHDHIIHGGFLYLITEYIEDVVDMFDYLESNIKYLTTLQRVMIMINLTRAVKTIHDLGIAHADLKPENVLINPDNLELQLIDFGGSCNQSRFENCGVTGTIEFGSPEYLDGIVSHKANLGNMNKYYAGDIFSLGLMFYLLINNNRLPVDKISNSQDQLERAKELLKIYSTDNNVGSNSGHTEIDNLINEMTNYDYQKRPKLQHILDKLDIILRNSQFM